MHYRSIVMYISRCISSFLQDILEKTMLRSLQRMRYMEDMEAIPAYRAF